MELPDLPTPAEALHYLAVPRGLRGRTYSVDLQRKGDQVLVYVVACVPRARQDGTPGARRLLLYGEACASAADAAIDAALRVRHYLRSTFPGHDTYQPARAER